MNEMISARRPSTAAPDADAATSGCISRIRVPMEMIAYSTASVMNAFTETQAFLVVNVNRILRWIEEQHDIDDDRDQVQPPPPSAFIDTPDVIPSFPVIFPLSFQYMFSDMNLQHLEGLNQLLSNNFIPQDFWEEFAAIVSSGIKQLADFATKTKSRGVFLSVEVDVVRMQPYDEEQFLRHVLILRSQFDPSSTVADDDQSNIMRASRESIDALESITFKRSVPAGNDGDEEMVDVSCSICLDEYSDGELIKKMPCSHQFHFGCIEGWLKKRNTCPLCRFQMPVAS